MQEHLVDAQTGGSGVKTQDTAFETRNLEKYSFFLVMLFIVQILIGLVAWKSQAVTSHFSSQ